MLEHPAVQRLRRVALALGPLNADVVFIGGAIAPLLHTDAPFEAARPTKDVDGVVVTTSYAQAERLHDTLRTLGFKQDPSTATHVHRWLSPAGDLLDLVPAGNHLGGSGQLWDTRALASCVEFVLDEEVSIRCASGPAFLALKWAAYGDRGDGDLYGSHDVEDIIALIAARPELHDEICAGPPDLRDFIIARTQQFVQERGLRDILAGHLNNTQDPARVHERVDERLRRIASL